MKQKLYQVPLSAMLLVATAGAVVVFIKAGDFGPNLDVKLLATFSILASAKYLHRRWAPRPPHKMTPWQVFVAAFQDPPERTDVYDSRPPIGISGSNRKAD